MSTDIPSTATAVRGGCLMPAFVLLFAVGVLAVAFVGATCIRGRPSSTYEAPLAQFAPDDPVFLSSRDVYVVRLASGDVIALDDHALSREDFLNGCSIRYRETLQANGRTGLFRGDCTGTVYDLTGTPIQGAGPPMKRHPVTVTDGTVKVDLTACTQGGATVPCKPA